MQDAEGFKTIQGGKAMTREEVVQAALTVERWCAEHEGRPCDCPFAFGDDCIVNANYPKHWFLEKFLLIRRVRHES